MPADFPRADAHIEDVSTDSAISLLPAAESSGETQATESDSLAGQAEHALAAPEGPALPDLVLSRLRELIVEAPTGAQLESLVRVAERLPQWQNALGETQQEFGEIEGMTLEEAVSEVRRIADLAEGVSRQVKK